MKIKRILNVGCGSDVYGTDFIDLYPERKEVVKCDVDKEKFPYPDGTFDEVYAENLIEHLTNISHFMRESKRVLKRKGKLIVITDNAGYWNFHMPFSKLHHEPLESSAHGQQDMHFALFTKRHLINLFEKFGFKNIEISESDTYTTRWEKAINSVLKISAVFERLSYQKIRIEGQK